jgi:hypothetical protein
MSPKVAKVNKATIGVADIIVSLCATNFANMHEHFREGEKSFDWQIFCHTKSPNNAHESDSSCT